MNTVKFSCAVGTSNVDIPLGLEVWIDDVCVIDTDHVRTTLNVLHEASDNDGEHSLRITLKNKLHEHTRIDTSGCIESDVWLTISDINFEGIDCTQIVHDHAVYQHNFNGTGADTLDRFFGNLGCNGTVELKFTTPLYLWLLENM